MTVVRSLLTLASPGGERGRLSVLVLHRVLPKPDALFPEAMDIPRFTELCRWVDSMFNVLPLEEAVRRLTGGSLPPRALAITFDDGYADNHDIALPILRAHGLPAAFFIATGFLDGGCMWNDIVIESFRVSARTEVDLSGLLQPGADRYSFESESQRRRAIEAVIAQVKYLPPKRRLDVVGDIAERLQVPVPTDLMMSSRQVVALHRAGMEIGAHTVSHPILANLDAAAQRNEMEMSKRALESLLGEPVRLFAYPNGKPGEDFDTESVQAARELGFTAAFTTLCGAATRHTDTLQLPRFTPWDRTELRFGVRMASTLWASRGHIAHATGVP